MGLEERLKSQKIVLAIAFVIISLISFNSAIKGTNTIIGILLGLVFLGMALFCFFGLKKKE